MSGASRRPRQLVFGLDMPEALSAEDFIAAPSNAAAREMIAQWPHWPGPALALVGPAGCGKSHLAAIWAQRAGALVMRGEGLDESVLTAAPSAVLVDGRPDAEAALFHLFNQMRENGASLLLVSRQAPAGWPVRIPDLASRLRAMPVVEIGPPEDALLRQVLVKLLADRQLAVDPVVLDFAVRRMERSLESVGRLVETLDRLALEERRPITRSLAARALDEIEREERPATR